MSDFYLSYSGQEVQDILTGVAPLVDVTASSTEINILDGATLSTSELNILDGVIADKDEINILNGATISTAELNFLDGVTSSIQTQIDDAVKDFMVIALSDESTAITVGTSKITFRVPYAITLYQVPRASLSTASTSGNPAIDINVNGTSIFSTVLTIDANEKTSTTATTSAVMTSSTINVVDDAEITIDVDTSGTGAKGAKVMLYFRRT